MPSFFLEPDRTEPHIPASVLAVVAFGFSTSAYLVGVKPWCKTCAAWTLVSYTLCAQPQADLAASSAMQL